MWTARVIERANARVAEAVSSCETASATVIARYTAAMAVNYTDWMGKTYPWLRAQEAKNVLIESMKDKQAGDHIGMMEFFAQQASALPSDSDHAHVKFQVVEIRQMLANTAAAGLNGLMLLTLLEHASEIIGPNLELRAKSCGAYDFSYIQRHATASAKNRRRFLEATEEESKRGYTNINATLVGATEAGIALIHKIWA